MSKRNKGFTLIELLVVIAIIGILSSVVLASLNTARNKGNNAKIKSQLAGARAAAEIFYDNNGGSYDGVCTDGASNPVTEYITEANYPGGDTVECTDSDGAYAIAYELTVAEGTSTHWCVDSTGQSVGRTAALGSDTDCSQ